MEAVLLFLVLIIVYFLPSWVAFSREKQNLLAIFMVNLIFGWTLLGWGIALVWACLKDEAKVIVKEVEKENS
jgi:hypothetical protein